MAHNPPKQMYSFSFDSPDLRARKVKKESIYDDSSDDESPRKPAPRMGMPNGAASGFGTTGQSRGAFTTFSGLNRHGGSVFTSAGVKTENLSAPSSLGKENTRMQGPGFGGLNAKESNMTGFAVANKTSPSAFMSNGGFGGGVFSSPAATNAQEITGRSALQDMELLGGLKSSGGGLPLPSSGFASVASSPGTSMFTPTTTTSGKARSVPSVQPTGTQGRQSLSPFGAPASAMAATAQATSSKNTTPQGMSSLRSTSSTAMTSGTSLFAAAATVTTQEAAVLSLQNSAPQVYNNSETSSLFMNVTSGTIQTNVVAPAVQDPASRALQSINLPAATNSASTTFSKPTKAQMEETRIFAAHMKLLDHSSASQELHEVSGAPLFTKKVLDHSEKLFSQYGFLAGISTILDLNSAMSLDTSKPSRPADPRLFFNISAPSSAFICGSQGSGKSHTLSCLLENCLMKSDVSKLENPLAGLVFHYDSFTSDIKGTPCEAAHISSNPNVKVRVLVSPTNLQTMKRTYAGLNVTVEPLRINQTDLNTKRMFDLMVVDQEGGKMPLYLHAISRILRDMRLKQQQSNTSFNYREFKRQVDLCDMSPHQLLPLNQRLDTLESFMPRSQTSTKPLAQSNVGGGNDFFGSNWSIKAGTLTIVDLSCPCVTAEGACGLFNMCLSLFLEQHTTVGRVIGLDEAHKYMNAGAEASSLTNTLLSAIRLQRHLGTRVFISTQEPTISPKLLDLCSITIVHRFTSPDWLKELKKHIASLDHDEDTPEKSNIRLMKIFNDIVKLRVGEAFLFAPSAIIGVEMKQNENELEEIEMQRLGNGYLKIKVRARVTADGGRSVFALGAQPTAKTDSNIFGFSAGKPIYGVPQAGSGTVSGIKPAKSLFQFPSTQGLNDSVFATGSTAAVTFSGSGRPTAAFGAPSPAPAFSSLFSNSSKAASFNSLGGGDFNPFQSADRTIISGAFTTSAPSIFSMLQSGTESPPTTTCTPFQPFVEREANSSTNQQNAFQGIAFQLPYIKYSPEELRLADYAAGVRYSGQFKQL